MRENNNIKDLFSINLEYTNFSLCIKKAVSLIFIYSKKSVILGKSTFKKMKTRNNNPGIIIPKRFIIPMLMD